MESILNKSKNFYRCIGTVYEKGLTREPCEVSIYEDGKPTGEKVKAECIKGKIAVRADKSIVTFGVYFASKGLDGKESRQWPMAESMMELNPEVNGDGNVPNTVVVEGRIEGNLFMSQDCKEVRETTNFRVTKVSTSIKPGVDPGMTVKLTGCVIKNVPETKMVDGEAEETGRGIMSTYVANNKGEVFPVNIIVPEDIVDDVNDVVENGVTIDADVDINVVTNGITKQKRSIGRAGRVDTSNVSTHTEFILAGMDIIEEPEELTTEDENGNEAPVKTYWMNPATVKKAIKMYQMKKDEFAKNGGNNNKNVKSSLAEKKAEFKAKRVGKKEDTFDGFDDFEDEDEF